MNVELTIQDMFDNYPTLFKERADCLNHLFCTIGNGYYWENGELVDSDISDEHIAALSDRLVDGKACQHNKLSLRDEHIYYFEENKRTNFSVIPQHRRKDYIENFNERVKSVPDNVYYNEPERRKRWSFYVNIPGHEHINYNKKYAKLWNYPENIKPDWLAAIEECKTLLREDGFDV